MSQENDRQNEKKAAMKMLRATRKESIRNASARAKAQKKALKAIKGHLEKGPGTVPEVADATEIPADQVLWYMAALKKYGEIVEAEKDGGYFRYALTERPVQAPS